MIRASLPDKPRVIEFGGLDVNGNVRLVLPEAEWYCVDIKDGPGVDEVADASTWKGQGYGDYDLGICLEVLEHSSQWREIASNLMNAVRDGGSFIMTAATDPRDPHGAYGDSYPAEGEWYQNVPMIELEEVLRSRAKVFSVTALDRGDVQAWGVT